MLLDEGSQINVHPRLVISSLAARHCDQAWQHAGHLNNCMKLFPTALRLGADKQVVAFVQELRERVTGIDGQRRQHRKNFFLKILVCPGRAFRAQFGHLWNADAIFR